MTMQATIGYGISRDEDRLTIVRAAKGRSGISYDQQWNGPVRQESAEWKNLIGRIYAEVWDGQAVTAVPVPVDKSIFRPLTTPFTSKKKAHRVLPSLLDIQLPFPLEEALTSFIDVSGNKTGPVSSLAVCMRREEYGTFLSDWQELGLDPVAVDHEGLAWWTWYLKKMPPTSSESRVIVAFGQNRSVVMIGTDKNLLGCYRWNKGVQQFSQQEDAWRDAVNRLQRICLAHKKACDDHPLHIIQTGSAIEASVCEAFECVWNAEDVKPAFSCDANGQTALASALAERALVSDMLPCNLRSVDVPHPAELQASGRNIKKSLVFTIILGLLLSAAAAGFYGVLYFRENRIKKHVTELATALTSMKSVPRGQEVLLAERSLESRREELRPFSKAVNDSVTGLLNDLLETAQTHEIKINRLVVRPDGILIRGTSPGWNDCDVLLPLLQKAGYRPAAPERQDAGMDERVHFQLQGALP